MSQPDRPIHIQITAPEAPKKTFMEKVREWTGPSVIVGLLAFGGIFVNQSLTPAPLAPPVSEICATELANFEKGREMGISNLALLDDPGCPAKPGDFHP